MSTPAKVQEWLRNNNGNLKDAYKAVGYEGPPLKIKGGNLTNLRRQIRVSLRGENGDATRKKNLKLNPPQNKNEVNQNRRQNYKARSLNAQGAKVHIDHKIDLKLLGETVEGMTPEQAKAHIKRLEQSYGPLGDRPGNRQIIGEFTNGRKAAQSKALQRYLRDMGKQTSPLQRLQQAANFAAKRGPGMALRAVNPYMQYIPEIDQVTGGHLERALQSGMDRAQAFGIHQLQRLVDAYASSKSSVSGFNADYGQ